MRTGARRGAARERGSLNFGVPARAEEPLAWPRGASRMNIVRVNPWGGSFS